MAVLNEILSSESFPKVIGLSQPNLVVSDTQQTEKELEAIVAQINTLLLSNTAESRVLTERLMHQIATMDLPESIKNNAVAKLPESIQAQIRSDSRKGSKDNIHNGAYASEMAYMLYTQNQTEKRLFTEEQMRRWANNPELLKLAQGVEGVYSEMNEFIQTDYATPEEAEEAGKKFLDNLDKQLEAALQRQREISQELNSLFEIPPEKRTPEQQQRINNLISESNDIDGMISQLDSEMAEQQQILSENPASRQEGTIESAKRTTLEEGQKKTANFFTGFRSMTQGISTSVKYYDNVIENIPVSVLTQEDNRTVNKFLESFVPNGNVTEQIQPTEYSADQIENYPYAQMNEDVSAVNDGNNITMNGVTIRIPSLGSSFVRNDGANSSDSVETIPDEMVPARLPNDTPIQTVNAEPTIAPQVPVSENGVQNNNQKRVVAPQTPEDSSVDSSQNSTVENENTHNSVKESSTTKTTTSMSTLSQNSQKFNENNTVVQNDGYAYC